MKNSIALMYLVASSLASAATEKVFCPEILAVSGLDVGADKNALKALYADQDTDGDWIFKQDNQQSFSTLQPLKMRNFRVTIEEQAISAGEVASKSVVVDCPVPGSWQQRTMPKMQFDFPAAIQNSARINLVSFSKTVNGITFDSLVGNKETLDITIYWKFFRPNLNTNFEVPAYIHVDQIFRTANGLTPDQTRPAVAVRFADSPRFTTLWHLFTEGNRQTADHNRRHFLGLDDENSDYFRLNLNEASKVTQSVSVLTYWDASSKKVVGCSAAADLQNPNSCFKLNYRLYKPILDAIDSGRPFFVQTLLQLKEGFLLNTYQVSSATKTSDLVRFEFVADINALGLPRSEWQQ